MAIVIKTFTTPGGKYIYDRETDSLLSVNDEEFQACQQVEEGLAKESDWQTLKRYTDQGYFQETRLKEISHPYTRYMRHQLENQMSQLTLQVTQGCNLRCSYCTYGNNYVNQRGHSDRTMPLETMKKGIDFIMARSFGVDKISVGFYGGEPLLEIDNIKACVEYAKDAYEGRSVLYVITTNGTLFDDDTIQFLEKNDFSLSISFDGPKDLHDKNRVFADGRGSFDKIMDNVSYLKQNYPKLFRKTSFLTTVAPNTDFSCVNDFYSADKVLEENTVMANTVNVYSVKNEMRYDDLYRLTNTYHTMKVLLSKLGLYSEDKTSKLFGPRFTDIQRMYKYLTKGAIVDKSHPGGPCVPGAMRPFVDVDGNIYPCERVSEGSKVMQIGNLDTGFDLDKANAILNVGKITEAECISCWNYIHCALCAAACDGGDSLSREERLVHCEPNKYATLNNYITICCLLENGYDFGKESDMNV